MFRKPAVILFSALALAGGVLGTSTAAMADPPWARGERGFHHGGPPGWAPAHGWRRHHEFGGHGRSYRGARFYENRRFGGHRGYGY
ncbi:hypothetical protein [Methylobacterium soli]|uniref:Sulfur globule protein n=1 Tax=Methylobacterium soli TaxID=553447 RepID=A0A6L3T1K3_9HYPH|nr:hypothetical protein [Methylobacterium soli]KAB1078936.1 hypothetical protein F6X53_13120 [Methylobacterium soli]GJE45859.1 hypothetical protein AEGHOMDF_5059 [Methylobacterium soli]